MLQNTIQPYVSIFCFVYGSITADQRNIVHQSDLKIKLKLSCLSSVRSCQQKIAMGAWYLRAHRIYQELIQMWRHSAPHDEHHVTACDDDDVVEESSFFCLRHEYRRSHDFPNTSLMGITITIKSLFISCMLFNAACFE